MKKLQELIMKDVRDSNIEWATLTQKAICDYIGENEIYVKDNNLFMYLAYDEDIKKLTNVKSLFKAIIDCYNDEGRTKYPGDKLRIYIATEIYNSLKEEDTVEDLVKTLKELSE